MKKIFQIYLADLKRISTNVVAIVIIMGLGIIPALYAWFNIMSNWDPYGEEATSQMHIAVYSEDEGMSIGDLKLCMGDSVIKGLKENDAIGWILQIAVKRHWSMFIVESAMQPLLCRRIFQLICLAS